jgi:hypothetical protein
MFVSSVDEKHQATKACKAGAKRHSDRSAGMAQQEALAVRFNVNGEEIETVNTFRYLGRELTSDDSDWEAVRRNLAKARARWGRLAKILSRDGASPKVMGQIFLAVVQSVLLFGSETWVLTDQMMDALRSFYLRSVRYITRMFIHKGANEQWVCPRTTDVLATAELEPIETYIARRKATVWQYAATTPIFQRCKACPRGRVHRKTWWRDDVPDGVDVNSINTIANVLGGGALVGASA